jgi:hypothetical protein
MQECPFVFRVVRFLSCAFVIEYRTLHTVLVSALLTGPGTGSLFDGSFAAGREIDQCRGVLSVLSVFVPRCLPSR